MLTMSKVGDDDVSSGRPVAHYKQTSVQNSQGSLKQFWQNSGDRTSSQEKQGRSAPTITSSKLKLI